MAHTTLPHRIQRATPWSAQAGCALAIGIVLLLVGGPIIALSLHHDDKGLPLIVGSGFALVGLVLVASGIHQFIAKAGVRETILELAELPVMRGVAHAGVVIQEGPVELQSLRANVVCVQETRREVLRDGRKRIESFYQQIWDTNLLDEGEVTLQNGERLERAIVLEIPQNAKPSGEQGSMKAIEWRIEIWGRVRGRPDFMHPFVIEVR